MVKKKANKGRKSKDFIKKDSAIEENNISERFNENDIYDEIDEFHNNQNKILLSTSYIPEKKSKKEKKINVYDVEDSSDDDDEYEEKISHFQKKMKSLKSPDSDEDVLLDDYKPNIKSWGNKATNFYGGENEMLINEDVDEDVKDAAQLEEEESMFLQQQLQKQLKDEDFDLDSILNKASSGKLEEHVELSNNVNLTKQEKIRLVKRTSPELKGIFNELKKQMKYIQKTILPFLKKYPNIQHFQNKYKLYTSYCVNLMFYLVLKYNQEVVYNHPILTSIKEHYLAIKELSEVENEYSGKTYISIITNFEEQANKMPTIKKEKGKKLQNIEDSDLLAENLNSIESKENIEDDSNDRRAIDYTISKNKGLTPRRKKENRNPRVKHRNKYRRALIRRKGQIRPVRTEMHKYDGEISGIKMGIVRSRK